MSRSPILRPAHSRHPWLFRSALGIRFAVFSPWIVLGGMIFLAGCDNPPPTQEQLGKIVNKLPDYPGADKAIELPYLDSASRPPKKHHP